MKVRQLAHEEINNRQRQFPLQVIAENISSPENVGMIFRICEAMGVKALLLSGESPIPPKRKISKTARSAEKMVTHRYEPRSSGLIQQLQQEGYLVYALEITNTSEDIRGVKFNSNQAVALLVGGERNGVDQASLDLVDGCLSIPLYGLNTSINVVTALSIGLYEVTRQWAQSEME